jgi:chorismate synthase
VAAGGLAREAIKALAPNLQITGYMVQMGAMHLDRGRFDAAAIRENPFFLPDATAVDAWSDYLDTVRKDQNSVGAAVEVMIRGCPPGLGAPVYAKLDTDLAAAMMSINAVKGVEIGEGMAAAALTGTDNADEIRMGNDGPRFLSNHAGGILGGISTGQDITVRFSVKPTSSITTPRRTIDRQGQEIDLITKGRHDPCVGIRAVPVAEAMAACVILDHLLMDRAQTGGVRGAIG